MIGKKRTPAGINKTDEPTGINFGLMTAINGRGELVLKEGVNDTFRGKKAILWAQESGRGGLTNRSKRTTRKEGKCRDYRGVLS